MAEHSKDITTLNTLIATLLDSVDGYEKSAGDIEQPDLAGKFRARAEERRAAATALQGVVREKGGDPEDDGTVTASAHRAFLNLKEAVTGKDDKAIVAEIERGEDYLKGKFETAMKDVDLDATSKAAVTTAWQSVKAGHDEMSALKHSMGA